MIKEVQLYYGLANGSFLWIVDEKDGHCKAQKTNAVLITFVTDNVSGWYEYLLSKGVKMKTTVIRPKKFPVEWFFFKDPGGYEFEIQKFLKLEISKIFI